MAKISKVVMTVVLALTLSLTLLASGAFAQETAPMQNSAHEVGRVASLTTHVQQNTQQMQPIVYKQEKTTAQSNYWCRRGYCRPGYRHYRYYRRGGVRCFWVRRGWGWYRRSVRVCRAW